MEILLIGYRGYLGSAIRTGLESDDTTGVVTCVSSSDPVLADREFLVRFHFIVYASGCSGVNSARADPVGCLAHVQRFVDLVGRLRDQRLIYLSSASVYGNTHGRVVDETDYDTTTDFTDHSDTARVYDVSKSLVDKIMHLADPSVTAAGVEWFGLRLGTVNGAFRSLPPRVDLLINKMWAAEGCITVGAPATLQRAVLDIHDLVRAVRTLVVAPRHHAQSGVYNMSSFDARVDEIARRVSSILDKPVVYADDGSAPSPYDFRMHTAKFETAFGFRFEGTIDTIVDSLVQFSA